MEAGRRVWRRGAAYIGGCAGTSDVEAGLAYGLPLSGTMAHSWIMSHRSEIEAFTRYMELYGEHAVLLLDTYDTLEAVRQIAAADLRPAAVRLDSGDLLTESRQARALLDDSGLRATKILASGDLDEHAITALVAGSAPIDGFGVGTALSTSSDAPALGGVYKLVEVEHDGQSEPVLKLSKGKATYPGVKQVWRSFSGAEAAGDLIARATENAPPEAVPLLEPVMRDGRRARMPPAIATLRDRAAVSIGTLPAGVRRLEGAAPYPVVVSEALTRLAADIGKRVPRLQAG